MIKLIDILTPDRTFSQVDANSKKRTLEIVSETAAANLNSDLINESKIFNALIARERLGSTGIGEGIAIPHCRLEGLDKTIGILAHLKNPIDFEAIDNKPVDIVLTLLVPEKSTEEHLQLLANLAQQFSQEDFRKQLRQAQDSKALYEIAVHYDD